MFGFLLPPQTGLLLGQQGARGRYCVKLSHVALQEVSRLDIMESIFLKSKITVLLFFSRLHALELYGTLPWQVLSHLFCSYINQEICPK